MNWPGEWSMDANIRCREVDEVLSEVNFTLTAPLLLVRGFLPLVCKSKEKKILIITSIVGSLTIAPALINLGNGYSIARAALNM
jgi:NAD(P)-dependent dehydrogenase (short-subunit alcohol dehydrogenase family)